MDIDKHEHERKRDKGGEQAAEPRERVIKKRNGEQTTERFVTTRASLDPHGEDDTREDD